MSYDVDAMSDPARASSFLDSAADGLAAMKNYILTAHVRRSAGAILDVGCGGGHDLELFASVGIRSVGIDQSSYLLDRARQRVNGSRASLVRSVAESLPFRSGAFAGARIERLLMHVEDPALVLRETVRCVREGGLITVFEPDWSKFTVRDDGGDRASDWFVQVHHPDIGGQLWHLLEEAGCEVLDRVEELSVWRDLEIIGFTAGLDAALERAIAANRISRDDGEKWLTEQRTRDALGNFYALLPKVLLVAEKREHQS
jgi:SAM-dependent methyltransferase